MTAAKIRLYVEHPLGQGQSVPLNRDQAHYLFGVMRLSVGDAVALFNGHDGEWQAKVAEAGKRGGTLAVGAQSQSLRMPPDLWLLFAPIKKARTDFIVEKAAETIEQEEAEKLAKKLQAGRMDLTDLLSQLRQMKRMGGLGGLMGLLPQVGNMKKQMAEANIDEKLLARQEAIILSMTPREREKPDILKASRKRRIAAGAGVEVQDVNRLLKQFDQMRGMMKKMNKLGRKKGKKGRMPALPPGMTLPGADAAGGPALPGGLGGAGGGLPKLPGLPGKGGFNPFGR